MLPLTSGFSICVHGLILSSRANIEDGPYRITSSDTTPTKVQTSLLLIQTEKLTSSCTSDTNVLIAAKI